MTKAIRVENADLSTWKVRIEVYDQKVPGVCNPLEDTLARTIDLDHPTYLAGATGDLYLTSTRYVLVKENGA